eukprot:TRINITY_DN58582_c0_g1_i1.p1 TRINITY_DN58582_c0_g1~~TRINITY_DN58582_c0_g1_i1.p1  ORF type:complete len:162 (+),score=4.09 TRINITY_DN58582_c0_g1_i1:578-1063(+)
MKSAIFDARSPLVEPHEMVDEGGEGIDSNFAPLRRFWRDPEVIGQFRSIRHNFTALFGHERAQPFQEIENSLRQLKTACTMLGRGEATLDATPDLYRRLRNDAFRPAEEDPLGETVDASVRRMETFCRNIIVPYQEAHGSPSLKSEDRPKAATIPSWRGRA